MRRPTKQNTHTHTYNHNSQTHETTNEHERTITTSSNNDRPPTNKKHYLPKRNTKAKCMHERTNEQNDQPLRKEQTITSTHAHATNCVCPAEARESELTVQREQSGRARWWRWRHVSLTRRPLTPHGVRRRVPPFQELKQDGRGEEPHLRTRVRVTPPG